MTESELDLEVTRLMKVSRARIWQAWSDPAALAQWWCPKPWTTEVRAFEFHAGGAFHTFMQGPNGGESDNPGCFLEVVPEQRIVFTSMLTGGWRPNAPWLGLTAVITMADEAEGTRYTARVMHKDAADSKRHEELGFFDGWATCLVQLEEAAAGI